MEPQKKKRSLSVEENLSHKKISLDASFLIETPPTDDSDSLKEFHDALMDTTRHPFLVHNWDRIKYLLSVGVTTTSINLVARTKTGTILGFLLSHRTFLWKGGEQKFLDIDFLFSRPSCRGQGVGRALVAEIEKRALMENLHAIVLHCPADAPDAWTFWKHMGFAYAINQINPLPADLIESLNTAVDARQPPLPRTGIAFCRWLAPPSVTPLSTYCSIRKPLYRDDFTCEAVALSPLIRICNHCIRKQCEDFKDQCKKTK